MRRLAHDTLPVQKHALVGEVFSDFTAGVRVMTSDGYPGRITAVLDGPFSSTESYEVVLDGGIGGGEYSAGQLRPLASHTAAETTDDSMSTEAATLHLATEDYPELGTILHDRLPNEQVKVYASRKTALTTDMPGQSSTPESGQMQKKDQAAEQLERALPQVEQVEPPDACSFCGHDQFENPTNTGRGTRMECAQCGGTMTSGGGQWQPDPPSAPENAASRQGDPRATINDLSAVHSSAEPARGREFINYFAVREQPAYDPDLGFHLVATWADVRRKAKAIKDSGGVRILAATGAGVVGEVQGEHHLYEASYNYVPGTRKVADWGCGCKWGAYAWGRSPAYKRFEGRQCSHVTALQYEAQSKGMFGRQVSEDAQRLPGQHQRSPVTVQYDRAGDTNLNRRTVPPGNMRRTFSTLASSPNSPSLSWDDIGDRHPHLYGDPEVHGEQAKHADGEGIGWAAARLAFDHPDHHDEEQDGQSYDLRFHEEEVDPRHIDHARHGAGDPRVAQAAHGYASNPGQVPPTVLVHRHGVYQVADGHHRAEGAKLVGAKVRAYVAYSPHENEPFHRDEDDEAPDRAPYHGAEPHPGVAEHRDEQMQWHNPHHGALDLAPVHAFACEMIRAKDDPDVILTMLAKHGVAQETALQITAWAASVVGDADGGSTQPGQDIPGLATRDTTELKKKPHHHDHHTNDSRAHAPEFGRGIGWYAPGLMWCDQCNGSGCGHCGGTGQVMSGVAPTGGPGVGDLSTTTSPVGDESTSAGEDSSGGVSATSSLQLHRALLQQFTADYAVDSFGGGNPAQTYQAPTQHSNSVNPASTGWATSADPQGWVRPLINNNYGLMSTSASDHEANYFTLDYLREQGQQYLAEHPEEAKLAAAWQTRVDTHQATAEGQPSLPEYTHAGLALKAADTGRVLMIQRSIKDESDPARGTWEFPGGGKEPGDKSSVHTGVREWEEEVGHPFPEGGHVSHTWRSGTYHGHVVTIPSESQIQFAAGRGLRCDSCGAVAAPSSSSGLHVANVVGLSTPSEMGGVDTDRSITRMQGVRSNNSGDLFQNVTADMDSPVSRYHQAGVAVGVASEWPVDALGTPRTLEALSQPRERLASGMGRALNSSSSLEPQAAGVTQSVLTPAGTVAPVCGACGGNLHVMNVNPDDPGGDDHEQSAWWHPADAKKNPALRQELKTNNPFGDIAKAAAVSTPCQTPEVIYDTKINDRTVGVTAEMPMDINLNAQQAETLDRNLHNMMEMTLAPMFPPPYAPPHKATLNDEPEPALPSTDGAVEDDPAPEAGVMSWAPGDPAPGQYLAAQPEIPWGYEGGPSPAPLSSEASFEDVPLTDLVAAFQATAAGQKLVAEAQGVDTSEGAQDENAQIAAMARAVLAGEVEVGANGISKSAMKEFSFAEQQELISEGATDGTRARNFDGLQIEGTHYALLGEGVPEEELWL